MLLADTHRHGTIGGVWARFVDWAHFAYGTGQFRPTYWAYCSVFYLLPVGAAHSVRLFIVVVVIAVPVAIVWRTLRMRRVPAVAVTVWAAALVLANPALYGALRPPVVAGGMSAGAHRREPGDSATVGTG